MELKPGYRQTELGLFPKDWIEKTIESFQPFVTSGSRGWAKYYAERGDLFVRITNMTRSSIYLDLNCSKYVRLPATKHEGERTQLQAGDLLISVTADIGIVSWVDSSIPTPAYINQHIALVRFPSLEVSSQYIAYFLAHIPSQKRFRAITDQGAKAGINLATVRQVSLVVPPTKTEQEAIATALSDADALIESLEKLVIKKRQIKQGAMQELITGKKRLPGFTGEWDIKTLSSFVLSHNSGVYKKSELYGLGCNILGVSDIYGIKCVDGQRFDQVPLSAAEQAKYTLKTNDLLYGESSLVREGIARTVYVTERGAGTAFAWHTRRYSVDQSGLNSAFLYYYLQGRLARKHMMDQSIQTALTGINTVAYFACPVITPSLPEQIAIAAILSDMDAEIERLEAKLAKARLIKAGMMHELLTGKIRLVGTQGATT